MKTDKYKIFSYKGNDILSIQHDDSYYYSAKDIAKLFGVEEYFYPDMKVYKFKGQVIDLIASKFILNFIGNLYKSNVHIKPSVNFVAFFNDKVLSDNKDYMAI